MQKIYEQSQAALFCFVAKKSIYFLESCLYADLINRFFWGLIL